MKTTTRRLGRRGLRGDDEPRGRQTNLGPPRRYSEPDGPRPQAQTRPRTTRPWSSRRSRDRDLQSLRPRRWQDRTLRKEAEEAGFEVVSAGCGPNDRAATTQAPRRSFSSSSPYRGDGTPARRGGRGLARRQAHRHLRYSPLGQTILPRPRQHDLAYSPPRPALALIQAATILSGKFDRAKEGVRAQSSVVIKAKACSTTRTSASQQFSKNKKLTG